MKNKIQSRYKKQLITFSLNRRGPISGGRQFQIGLLFSVFFQYLQLHQADIGLNRLFCNVCSDFATSRVHANDS